jgi:MFS family permease
MAAMGFPSYQAMLPDLVGTEDLLGAVSLSSAQFNLGRVIGPALAGVVVHFGSYTWAFALNAASFGATMVALLLMDVDSPRASGDETLWQRIADGVRAARDDLGCQTALLVGGILAVTASPFIALIPAIAVVLFHGDAGTTAVLVTAQGVGAVAGALALAPLAESFGRRRMLVLNLFLLPVALVLYASAPTLALAAVALGLVGATYISVFSGLNVVLQLRAPPELRARVLSLYFVVVGVVYPIFGIVQGKFADHVGLRQVTAGGAVTLAIAAVLLVVFRRRRVLALDDSAARQALGGDIRR